MSQATGRTSREDVVRAAGRLFAERGYHGTSMRDLGRELGLLGSSLYSHVGSKEELLVEVVARGAELFQSSADAALALGGTADERLRALIAGHVAVVLDHREEVQTFLNEARALDPERRDQVVDARNRYEAAFRRVLAEGSRSGLFRSNLDPSLAAIFVLSIVNAIDRWYSPTGRLDRERLVAEIWAFVESGIR